MLFRRIRRTTASTGVTLTVTHALNVVPDVWFPQDVSGRGRGRTVAMAATLLTNTVAIVNSTQTTVTVDVFVMAFKGELY